MEMDPDFWPNQLTELDRINSVDQIPSRDSEAYNQIYQYIAHLMDNNIDFLLSLLYRLDVREKDIKLALSPSNQQNPVNTLIDLILARQLERIKTKEKYSTPSKNIMENDLSW